MTQFRAGFVAGRGVGGVEFGATAVAPMTTAAGVAFALEPLTDRGVGFERDFGDPREASVERAMFWHKDHGVECVRREPLEAIAEAVASAVIGTDIGIVGIGAGIGIGVGVGVVWQQRVIEASMRTLRAGEMSHKRSL